MPPRQKEVRNVLGIEAPIRHRIGFRNQAMIGTRPERLIKLLQVLRIGEVQIEVPGNAGGPVRIRYALLDIVLREDMIAHHPIAFTFPAQKGNPMQGVPSPLVFLRFERFFKKDQFAKMAIIP